MHRSHGAIHIGGAAEAGAVLAVKLGSLRGGWVDLGDSVHGVVDLLWLLSNPVPARRRRASRKLTFVNRIVTRAGASREKESVFKSNRDRQCSIEFLLPAALQGTSHNASGEDFRKAH